MQAVMLILWLAILAGGFFASIHFLKKLGLYEESDSARES